jgi:hypothetical protein
MDNEITAIKDQIASRRPLAMTEEWKRRHMEEAINKKWKVVAGSLAAGRREYRGRFVRAGQVRGAGDRPGNLVIEAGALEKACARGLFNGCAVFLDHAGLFDYPSLRNLVGVTRQARYDPQEASVEGVLSFYSTPAAEAAASLLDGLLTEGESAPDVGLSMVFWPEMDAASAEAVSPRVVGIHHVESVDLVFEPAAGGKVLDALASAFVRFDSKGGKPMEIKNDVPVVLDADAAIPPGEKQDLKDEAEKWLRELRTATVQSLLEVSGLPQASRERLSALAESETLREPAQLQQAIEAECVYLARLQENGVVQMGGPAPRSPQVTGVRTGLDQVSQAFEALLAGTRPAQGVQPLSGVRELYHLLSGDFEMNGLFHPERVYLANVNSSSMAGLVANALNKRLANEFMQYPQWWAPVVSEEDFASLQQVKWITLGGVGELPTVAEGAAYTELSWDDQTETASFVKKGGYLGLTLEAIDKDDTGRLRAAPRALAQAAWLTLAKAISTIFTDSSGVGPAMSDSLALFHSTHGNLGSTALSMTSYAAARTAMRKMTELNSGERLGALTAPKYLLVPPDLEITALQVLASQFDYAYTLANGQAAPENVLAEGDGRQERLSLARQRVIVVDLWTDSNNWAAAADPRLWPTIGVAYRYGRVPEIFSVASPTAGLMFSNDTMPVKVRFFFAAGPVDWRGLYKANVA